MEQRDDEFHAFAEAPDMPPEEQRVTPGAWIAPMAVFSLIFWGAVIVWGMF